MADKLVEIDSLEALVIIDNELDVLSPVDPEKVVAYGNLGHIAMASPHVAHDRGGATKVLGMDRICCASWGLSVLLTATRGDQKHSILFDTGPEEDAWEKNVKRLSPDLASVEVIHLSHWHRDHSGGMLKAIRMINDAKIAKHDNKRRLVVDLHPARPDFRGMQIGEELISLEADPSFKEIEEAGAKVATNSSGHTVLDSMFLVSGEIPRETSYEVGIKNGIRFIESSKSWAKDELIMDERFLMCNVKGKGLVVFTGCSHAGVVNTARHAVKLAGNSVPLHAVVGGFHLGTSEMKDIEQTVKDLRELDPDILLPGHCTGWRAKFEIEKQMPGRLVPCSVGLKYTFDALCR